MFALSFVTLAAASVARAATYSVSDTFIGSSFLNGFTHEAIADPTHGRVNYVDQTTAQRLNLTYASGNTFVLRSDYTATLNPSGAGRNSVRIQSKKQWSTHVEILDVRHMPQGCGSWPAYWTTNTANWPAAGEIDIIEGVNDQAPNAATLHTTAGCTQPFTPRPPPPTATGKSTATRDAVSKTPSPTRTVHHSTPTAEDDYVNNNPAAFKNAYWDIAALRVYQ
ncbi:unnamed protein product [Rhizoctonia solani]|nr:unnamed protein product [Rhizoctonia solani]